VTGHLRTPEDYELITYRLMERLKAQNVLHAEVIVSVGVCLWRKQDFAAIFEGLERGRQRGEKDFGISLLWIFDAIRQFGAEKAQSVLDLAIQFRDRNVVAFGIGGDERRVRRSGSRRSTRAPRSTAFISRRTPVKAPDRNPFGAR
jgi:aminodeoxyfutalosine deaminase